MKLSRFFILVLIATLLFATLGFQSQPSSSAPMPLTINSNCTVSPDPAPVQIGTDVIWNPPNSSPPYSLDFGSYSPISTSPVPAGTKQTVKGSLFCNRYTVSVLTGTRLCYFQYSIYKGDHKPCNDPGVRVVPPGNFGLFIWLVALLGVVSYTFFRMRARNRESLRK